MNSLTRTAQGVASDCRHGRSRAASQYQWIVFVTTRCVSTAATVGGWRPRTRAGQRRAMLRPLFGLGCCLFDCRSRPTSWLHGRFLVRCSVVTCCSCPLPGCGTASGQLLALRRPADRSSRLAASAESAPVGDGKVEPFCCGIVLALSAVNFDLVGLVLVSVSIRGGQPQ